MVMIPQQARMAAMRLRAEKPELRNMDIDDLAAQIMASEGGTSPGAGVGGLANLFATKLTPASPAPMRAAQLEAPKPTAAIVPTANAAQSGRGMAAGAPRNPPLAPWQVEHLDRMKAGLNAPAAEAAPVAVAEAAPAVAAEAPAKPQVRSRFRPMLDQKQAELDELNQRISMATQTGQPVPPELSYNLDVLSREVSQLKGLVSAEEGAVVDADRAAILERQTKRLGREEELVEQARRRAPFDALIAGGSALAEARPGENFASALARGLRAGAQSYTGARDAREAALRGIEERRDAFALQGIDAALKAREDAIALQSSGAAMTEQQTKLANMSREGAAAAAMAPFKQRAAEAETKTLETGARYADQLAQLDIQLAEANVESTRALADYRKNPPARGTAPKPVAGVISALTSRINVLTKALGDPLVSKADKDAYRAELKSTQQELRDYKRQFNIGGGAPAPAFGPVKPAPAKPTRTYNPKTGKLE